MGDPHAFAAPAGGGLDHHRVADLVGDPHRLPVVFDNTEMARDGGNPRRGSRLLAFDLVAHGGDGFWVWTDEDDAGFPKGNRKRLAFGQKPIARMHRLGATCPACGYDLVDDEVALGSLRRPDR